MAAAARFSTAGVQRLKGRGAKGLGGGGMQNAIIHERMLNRSYFHA